MRSWRGGSWEDAGGLGLASSSDDGSKLGEGTLKPSSGGSDTSRADSDGTGASCGGSGCGGTGSSTKPILDVDFFFSLAISFKMRALRGPAVPLLLAERRSLRHQVVWHLNVGPEQGLDEGRVLTQRPLLAPQAQASPRKTLIWLAVLAWLAP